MAVIAVARRADEPPPVVHVGDGDVVERAAEAREVVVGEHGHVDDLRHAVGQDRGVMADVAEVVLEQRVGEFIAGVVSPTGRTGLPGRA